MATTKTSEDIGIKTPRPSVCVIGAGPSGITTIKTLRQAGIENITCFEASSEIGGNWVFGDEPGHPGVYETTHTISSKKRSEYSDFPMPADYPDYPSHAQILAYHQNYAAQFAVMDKIQLNTRVLDAVPQNDGGWRVETEGPGGKQTNDFNHLIVCSGHHWDPNWPTYPGSFSGQQIHAHDYRRAANFKDKRVLVVGAGNSGCDIACAISAVAAKTEISMRSPQYIFPKMLFGRPIDKMFYKARAWPRYLRKILAHLALWAFVGPYEKYGLQTPTADILSMHPTLNSEIFDCLAHGTLAIKPGIERLDGNSVYFVDGESEEFDAIVWATGYRISFPFFATGILDFDPNESLKLYQQIVPSKFPSLYFIGLLQPVGCIWNLSEIQAEYVAALINGDCFLPADIDDQIDRGIAHRKRLFPKGHRHLASVFHHQYAQAMQKLIGKTS